MKGYAIKPGVIEPGHDAAQGWHPGAKDDCPECKPRCTTRGTPQTKLPKVEVKVTVTIPFDQGTMGSDCPTGKRQFVSRQAALGAFHSVQRRGGTGPAPYRCPWCMCWHTGNRRAANSKGRTRR